ncbi:MAG: TolC family protein [Bernardetiaceae bacterium]|nr:TolC family protein [Bernardetiaceae bacterium]
MQKQSILLVLTFFLFFCPSLTKAQDSLSLAEVFDMLRLYHPLMRQAELMPAFAQEEIRYARGAFEPSVYANLTAKEYKTTQYYNRFQGDLKIPTLLGFDISAGYERAQGEFLNPELRVPNEGLLYAGITLPVLRNLIFDSRRAMLNKANIFYDMSLAEQQKMINKLYFDAAKAYWDWYTSYEKMLLQEESVRIAEERLEGIRDAAELGRFRGIDSVEARLETQRREVDYRQSLIDYEAARLMLSNFLWDEDNVPVFLSPDVFPSSAGSEREVFSLDGRLEFAREQHPEIMSTMQKIAAREVDLKLSKFMLMPIVNLDVKPILYPTDNEAAFMQDYKLGVTVYAPLFLRKERAKLGMSRIKLQQETLGFSFLQQRISNEVRQAHQSIEELSKMRDLQEQNVANALILRDGEQTLFELGRSTFFLINLRDRFYIDSRLKAVDLIGKYAKAKAQLRFVSGNFAE